MLSGEGSTMNFHTITSFLSCPRPNFPAHITKFSLSTLALCTLCTGVCPLGSGSVNRWHWSATEARGVAGADARGACRDGTSNCCCWLRFASIKLVLLTPGRAAFVLVKGRHVIQTKALGRSCGLIPLVGAAESPPATPPLFRGARCSCCVWIQFNLFATCAHF